MKTTYISWTRFDHRSVLLAKHLEATLHFVYYGQQGKVFQAPWRYLLQGLKTWKILNQERPELIFVQNPPIFCALLAALYSWRRGSRFVIDSHTAAFLSPKWRGTLWLHRLLSKYALVTIVHNDSQAAMVKQWGCRYFILADALKGYPEGMSLPLEPGFNIAVISTFAEDEPLDIVFEAAGKLADVSFYVTGDSKNIASHLLAKKPPNLHLTGFLTYEAYIGLLRAVDVILDLTTRNHTVLCGAFEAVSLGKPLITSDWQILREQFPMGAIHIPNTVEGVCSGVHQAQAGISRLQGEALILREKLSKAWSERFAELGDLILSEMTKP